MQRLISLLAILGLSFLSTAQAPLTVGDTIPPPIWESIRAKAPMHKGYWLIDFMASWCTNCIKALPYHRQLQQEQAGRLQFLLVTKEPNQKFTAFWQTNKLTRQQTFPFMTDDTLLSSSFPHKSLSHLVWLNPYGVVMAITGSNQVTAANIKTFVAGRLLPWPVKNDFLRYDYKQPLFAINQAVVPGYSIPQQSFCTAFTSFMSGLQHGARYYPDSASGTLRICFLNLSIPQLFRAAFGLHRNKNIQFHWQGADSSRFVYREELGSLEEWNSSHTFCYEAFFLLSTPVEQRTKKILADLEFYTACSATLTGSATHPVITIIQHTAQP